MSSQESIYSQVSAVLSERLNLAATPLTIDLIETGILDSLKFVELLLGLEQQFGIQIPIEDLEIDNFRSIETIAAFIISLDGSGKARTNS